MSNQPNPPATMVAAPASANRYALYSAASGPIFLIASLNENGSGRGEARYETGVVRQSSAKGRRYKEVVRDRCVPIASRTKDRDA